MRILRIFQDGEGALFPTLSLQLFEEESEQKQGLCSVGENSVGMQKTEQSILI
jgi:hypothetical protein